MESTDHQNEDFTSQMVRYAKYLHEQGWTADKIKAALISHGLDETNAAFITDSFSKKQLTFRCKKKAPVKKANNGGKAEFVFTCIEILAEVLLFF
ncbi:UBA domain-containing protein [Mucilaginibacter pedocola]|uniref:Uncharacterized protein n=1 Tax=Mucilaginibacter pedocola TaxID=1792845 RepID=A0A1S9PEQ9_9SPHI|nr:hypothetical protein [Mucilaginibacter pedocola]OOQ59424.1 hypothetical protein BC343_04375 [Mucilaginibacter pedocola]